MVQQPKSDVPLDELAVLQALSDEKFQSEIFAMNMRQGLTEHDTLQLGGRHKARIILM